VNPGTGEGKGAAGPPGRPRVIARRGAQRPDVAIGSTRAAPSAPAGVRPSAAAACSEHREASAPSAPPDVQHANIVNIVGPGAQLAPSES
jgi:hypothetical protein